MIPESIKNLKSKIKNRVRRRHGRLLRHYFLISVILVAGGLVVSGLLEIFFRYRESKEHLALLQQEAASVAALKIERFIQDIETAMKAAAKGQGTAPDFKFELKRLLYLAPAITHATIVDGEGIRLVQLSRLRVVSAGEHTDYSSSMAFQQARRGQPYFSPVFFARNSEPYLTIALPIEHFKGEIVGALLADVNLKYVWDVVSSIKAGKAGYAYAVARSGDLVAHPDIALVLQNRNLAHLGQVRAAFGSAAEAGKFREAKNIHDNEVISSFALIPHLDWAVFIERPLKEVYETLYGSVLRTSTLLLIGLGMALLASGLIARRVLRPLRRLGEGVDRIGRGDLNSRVDLKTGDEIETLAEQFNKMAAALQDAYNRLEEKVAERTQELAMANERLKELDKMKSDFVSNVSHELRTPLTAIKGSADNMLDGLTGPLNQKQARYLTRIKSSTDRLGRFINDILDLSKIEAGKFELKPSPIPLIALAREVTENLRPLADDKMIRVEIICPDPRVAVWADRDKVAQVLTNLIGNAVKFAPSESNVAVTVSRNSAGWVQVSVTDSGPGIPQNEADKIFEKFYQIGQTGGQKPIGTGIGLAISRALVEAHGGNIWVQSEGEKGTTFCFTLPAEQHTTSAKHAI
jgi:signal transduction histidine kinase